MNGVIDFYRKPPGDYRKTLPSGLICTAPIPFRLGTYADRLDLIRIDNKADPKSAEYQLVGTDLRNFDPTGTRAMSHLNLKSDEFVLSVAYKYRRCVITSEPVQGGVHESPGEQGFVVTPLYTTRNAAGDFKNYIDYEMVLRAQAYQLDNVFYLPESAEFDQKESFARLDRTCFVNKDLLQPRPVALTEKALELLREWTWKSLGFPLEGLDPALDKYMEKAAKALHARLGRQGARAPGAD